MQPKNAKLLALKLMHMHGLIKAGWDFKFDNAKIRFGLCNYRTKVISLSRHLVKLNDEAATIDTLLHEIAHALVGHKHGHNRVWRTKAREIGCNGMRCHTHETVAPKYTGHCPSCKREIKKHRRNAVACGKCCRLYNGGRFKHEYLIVWQ